LPFFAKNPTSNCTVKPGKAPYMFTVVVITREAKRAHEAYWSGGYDTTPVANSGIIRIKVPISYANSTTPDPI